VEALPHVLRTISAALLAQQSGFVWIGQKQAESAMQMALHGSRRAAPEITFGARTQRATGIARPLSRPFPTPDGQTGKKVIVDR